MRLAGYQPQFFPRLHYMNRILASDIFEVSDYVQFVKKHAFPTADGSMKRGVSYQAHTPIKLGSGEFLLVIPAHEEMLAINKTRIDYSQNWAEKMLKTIEVGYRKSRNFDKFFPEVSEILSKKYDNLSDLTLKTTLWSLVRTVTDEPVDVDKLDVTSAISILGKSNNPFRLREIFLASESSVPSPEKGKTNEWIIELCKFAKADEYYYGGTSHSAYMDLEKIEASGIKTVLQEWKCLEYPQQYMKVGFLPNLSAIDLLMNTDLETRQKILS